MTAPYQNGVAVRTHGRPEPLVGLEINLNVRVVQQDGAIPWRKASSKNTDQQERGRARAPSL